MTVRIGEAHRLWHRGIGVVNRELRWVAAIACAIISLAFVGWPRVSIADLPGVFPGTFTYHNDNLRTGQNLGETVLTPANVNAGSFGRLFSDPVDGQVYAEPLYVPGVSIPGQGTHNVVYVATENDTVYAFDGDAVGPPLWQTSLLPQGATAIPSSDTGCIIPQPEIGIPSTPVIDPVTQTIYVVAASKEGTNYVQRLHALDITTGLEQPGSPIVIQAQVTAPPGTISIVGGPQGNATLTGAFITVNSSTGVTSGDVIFAYVGTQSSTNITVTTPTGWTLLAGPLNPSTGINSYLFQRISDGTDGASYTFNFSGNVSAVSYAHQITYRGVNNTTPLDGSVTTASQTSGTSLVLPAVSPVGPSDLLVAFVEDYGGFSGTVASTGMTNEASTGENAILDQQLASSGSTGTRTVTNLNSSVSAGFLFAVMPLQGDGAATSDSATSIVAVSKSPSDSAATSGRVLQVSTTPSNGALLHSFRVHGQYAHDWSAAQCHDLICCASSKPSRSSAVRGGKSRFYGHLVLGFTITVTYQGVVQAA